ncbi:hypothetical protein H257_11644 [Aphanomyces astaci]|uniref:Uncharacterized protein n=1 Tax=Aphanomyces astaci TaxID=112090 RepID=W4G1E7_APHAT|nr:hypothetical protein H257_11644 [Aphanomyces astaci]ETV73520.1 hypothetical protein H257_11644 [Aphanomyces astaci]|eukprot:XP_009836946.1 hypothetical protein H257_11644 [Aphanomyces astaci]
MLLARMHHDQLPYGAVSDVARHFQCHRVTISRLWKNGRLSLLHGAPMADIAAKIRARRSVEIIEATIKAVPQEDRQTQRSLAAHSGIPQTTIMRHMAATKKPMPHSSHVKPFLTDANKTKRLHEELAHRAAKIQTIIAKVMFLAAVARPRYDPHLRQEFDGKLCIWPFVQRVPGARNS